MRRLLDVLTFGPWRRRRQFDAGLAALLDGSAPVSRRVAQPKRRSDDEDWSPVASRCSDRPPSVRTFVDYRTGMLVVAVATVAVVLLSTLLGPGATVMRNLNKGIPLADLSILDPYAADSPRPSPSGQSVRVLSAVTPPAGEGGFALITEFEGSPISYDPCRTIYYAIRPQASTDAMVQAVHHAFKKASIASGLHFAYDGPTDEAPDNARQPFQPDRYGQRWAPILVAFSDDDETPEFASDVVGLGGSTSVVHGTAVAPRATYVTGLIRLDTPELREVSDPRTLTEHVTMHEIGHVLGLDHVEQHGQIMTQRADTRTTYSDGDRRGLALLGSGRCAPTL